MPSPAVEALMVAAPAALAGGGLSQLFRIKSRNKFETAESAVVLTKAYGLLVEDLRQEIHSLREEIAMLRERLAVAEAQVTTTTSVTKPI